MAEPCPLLGWALHHCRRRPCSKLLELATATSTLLSCTGRRLGAASWRSNCPSPAPRAHQIQGRAIHHFEALVHLCRERPCRARHQEKPRVKSLPKHTQIQKPPTFDAIYATGIEWKSRNVLTVS